MHQSIIPANTKKSILLLGFLRGIDAIVLGIGVAITVFLLLVFESSNTWALFAECIPMLIGVVLVIPIPNYHNTMCCIESITTYNNSRRNYMWKGWCSKDEYK